MEDPNRRSKTQGQTSASDPNPTATSPSASAPTGDATTASLVPSSAFPSAPPTTTTTTQIIPSAPPRTTSLLPSSPSQITASTKPFPGAPPLPIRKAHQERISCTSSGATTTDLACRSTAPSASATSTRTPTVLLPITDEFMSHFAPAVSGAVAALQSVKEEDPPELQEMVAAWFCSQLDKMESVIGSLLVFAEKMEGDPKLKAPLMALFNLAVLESAAEVVEMLFAERKERHGSGGSCGGSEREGGGLDGGSGEGDGEGGGVSV